MAVIDPHYIWAFGHVTMLSGAIYIMLQNLLFRGTPTFVYKLSYTGALLSYFIVVYKSLGKPQINQAWLRRAFVDENVQYAVLAVFWWISKPMSLTILPFATFSLFHTLTFIRTNIIPKLVPTPAAPVTGAGAGANAARQPPAALDNLSRKIQLWVKGNYDTAMRFVAFTELAILARTVLGAITFRSSFLAPLFLAHFIRLRYHASPFTRQAVGAATSRVDNFANGQGGAVKGIWEKVKVGVSTWGGGNLVPGQQQQGAAGTGAGAGAGTGAGAGAARGAGTARAGTAGTARAR